MTTAMKRTVTTPKPTSKPRRVRFSFWDGVYVGGVYVGGVYVGGVYGETADFVCAFCCFLR